MTTPRKHTFFVAGTHCVSCKIRIEDTLSMHEEYSKVHVSIAKGLLTFESQDNRESEKFTESLNTILHPLGYSVSLEKSEEKKQWSDWWFALLALGVIVAMLYGLEQFGLASRIGEIESVYVTAFVVGLVASVSTCLAVVGGLVLSVSATYVRSETEWKPQALFHVGRFVGFFVLGGILGLLGSAIQVGLYGSMVLGVVVSLVMLVLGIQLLGVTKHIRFITLPKNVLRFCMSFVSRAGSVAPLLLGVVTFFLPCGFTQAMQVVALSSGSFITGAFVMTLFAVGTFPVLALLSFGSLDLAKSKYREVFFKTAGMVVILFGAYTLYGSFLALGIISPLL
jgi:uncharacterized protein